MYELYSWLALVLSISFFAVAIAMTILRTKRLVDIAFTIREWLLGGLFCITFIVTQGPPDRSFDIFHSQMAQIRVAFMMVVLVASLIAVGALVYTFYNRRSE